MWVQPRTRRCGRTSRAISAIVLAAVVASAFGCTSWAPAPVVDSRLPYRVGAPDTLVITILPEPTIEAEVTVRPDGMITVPLIGEVPARERTIPEIAADIEERIARFKREPKVDVALVAAASTDIVILGEVRRQDSFPLVKETRVIEAIGMVGGTTPFGWTSRIRVIRTARNGSTEILRVNLNAIRKGDLSTNLMLEPGDFVFVPPTPWARFGYALNTLLFPFQPLMGVAMGVGGNLITGN